MTRTRDMVVGIDLHNIRDGGGMNYIRNLLEAADPVADRFAEIHLFGAAKVLDAFPDRLWIIKHAYPELERSLWARLRFVARRLPAEFKAAGCDILYCPGGIAFGNIHPYVTISRNMLPFRSEFWRMYPRFSLERLRLQLLRRRNTATFVDADGMIYLSDTARKVISAALRRQPPRVAVIPHGVDHGRFSGVPRTSAPNPDAPIAIIYPSRLEPYKHQLEVIAAFSAVMDEFALASLTFCGPANPPYRQQVEEAMVRVDPSGARLRYVGEVPNADLPALYADSDLLLFASSCENLPNILIEAMACGIPICCSSRSPMPEIAQDACVYFDPTQSDQIATAIRDVLRNRAATLKRSHAAMTLAADYSWAKTARRTFALIADTAADAASS